MKNLKIKAKLLLSFLVVAAFCGIVGIMGVLGLIQLNNSQETMYVYATNSDLASELIINITEQRVRYRDVILAVGNTEKLNSAISSLDEKSQKYDKITAQLGERLLTATGRGYLEKINTAYTAFAAYEERLTAAAKAGRSQEAENIMAEMLPSVNAVSNEALALSNFALEIMGETNVEDGKVAVLLITALSVLAVVAVAVAVILGSFTSRQISRPILRMVEAARSMAEGDISVDVSTDTRDETGDLAQSFQGMIGGIQQQATALGRVADGDYTVAVPVRSEKDVMNKAIMSLVDNGSQMMTELRTASSQVASGAGQIAQGAQSLASGSSEQAAGIEEFSAALIKTQARTEQNANSAQQALTSTAKAGELLAEGMRSMEKTLGAMRSIEESSQSITRVIKVIDDIAFQTNILALNAAVEAARAGQHGKGFAVVADEVRNLASKSAAAAHETAGLIEGSNQRVNDGNRYVAQTNESLEAVVKSAQESLELMQVIAKVSGQQSDSISEITAGIGQISQVVQANSATAEESAAAAQEMSAQADLLTNIVSRFKLRDSASYAGQNSRGGSESSYNGRFPQDGFALSDDKY